MPSVVRHVPFLALSALSAAALLHCGSSDPTGAPTSDAGPRLVATLDGGPVDASPSPPDDAASDAPPSDAATDASDSAPPPPPPCNVRTSGTDAGLVDPTYQPFTWSAPASDSIDITYPPLLAVAPGGDAYVALELTSVEAGVSEGVLLDVLHLQASGAIDPSFGTGGVVTLSSWTRLYGLIVDHNGDIVVTGLTPTSATVTNAFALLALRPDGSTDFQVDAVDVGGTQPCAGCIADGLDGYLTPSYTAMFNVTSGGAVTQTDTLPTVSEPFDVCRMARSSAALSLYCGYGGAGGGEALRYDLHGVLDPSFGTGGAFGAEWDPMLAPWVPSDGSLYLAGDFVLGGDDTLMHLLANGTIDPAYPSLGTVMTPSAVAYATARCDGTELFFEGAGGAGFTMQTLGPSGPPLASAGTGTLPSPDGGSAWTVAYGADSHGAILVVSELAATSLQVFRVLPSK